MLFIAAAAIACTAATAQNRFGNRADSSSVKIALNLYSFNSPLTDGSETLESVIDYAASLGYAALDMTGYYFSTYPAAPSDEEIYRTKYRAFRRGIQICGTGVRNDFTLADRAALEKEKQLVKDWIVVAAKLGASTLRIFAGEGVPQGSTREATARQVAEAINECAAVAESYGIVIALQNHNDFLKTAEDVEQLFSRIRSEAVGLMLDIGSYRSEPYREIERTIGYAVTWQVKETVFENGLETKTDVGRVMDIIRKGGYCGYVPIEIIGKGNERERVRRLLEELKAAL